MASKTNLGLIGPNRSPGVKVLAMEPGELSTLFLNITEKPLDDIRVREAIAYGVDRKEIVAFKGAGTSREAVSVVPSGYLGSDEHAPLFPYDTAKAKELLRQAGYPDGVTIKTIHRRSQAWRRSLRRSRRD